MKKSYVLTVSIKEFHDPYKEHYLDTHVLRVENDSVLYVIAHTIMNAVRHICKLMEV